MALVAYRLSLTTDGSGAVTDYTSTVVGGLVYAIQYSKDDFAAGVDFEIRTETTEIPVWVENDVNVSRRLIPLHACHDDAGAEINWDTGVKMLTPVPVANERIRVSITNGGATKHGFVGILVLTNTYSD